MFKFQTVKTFKAIFNNQRLKIVYNTTALLYIDKLI
jgi:hypothetical protein